VDDVGRRELDGGPLQFGDGVSADEGGFLFYVSTYTFSNSPLLLFAGCHFVLFMISSGIRRVILVDY
jgi:hypothetical protein